MTQTTSRTDTIDVALRVMDHQLVGPSGALLGNVDNLVLGQEREELLIVGVLSGPGGFGPRQPGLLGRWIVAVWKRLSSREQPSPLMVPMSHVRHIGSAVTVSDYAEGIMEGAPGLEQWLRRHVISPIPGATAGDDRLAGTTVGSAASHDELTPPMDSHLVSDLLGAKVVDDTGASLGTVMELRGLPFEQSGLEVGRLRVTSVVFGPRRLGGELGYTTVTDQGPWLLARFFGWWHRDDREVAWSDVADVDWDNQRLLLRAGGTWRHPHATGGEA
jgi:sporulation protein YlmC with PRC-barrel domain